MYVYCSSGYLEKHRDEEANLLSCLLDPVVKRNRRPPVHHGRLGLQPQLIYPFAKVTEEVPENLVWFEIVNSNIDLPWSILPCI